MFLSLIYKLDFLITPEGKLLNEIERINNLYWLNKEDKTAVERNQLLKDAFQKLLLWDKAEVLKYFYRAKSHLFGECAKTSASAYRWRQICFR
ncbi:MAG: hypothetical protein IPI22_14250 [Bacteroidetes bacterium]|nr:hypothetical protein [Bacteroidota bacterium]